MDLKEKVSLVNKLNGEILDEIAGKFNEVLKLADEAGVRVVDDNDSAFYLESFDTNEDRYGHPCIRFFTREE